MRVLIAGHALDHFGGVQSYERDLARWLLDRGHSPVIYSTLLGEAARHLDQLTIPVTDNLASIGFVPDIIHGDSPTETVAALLHFSSAPAVFVCHGWDMLASPAFPRVLRYIAVDDTCADRLTTREGHPPEKIVVLLNAVNLDRFEQRAPLPKTPRRAIAFGNSAHELTYLPLVRQACESMSITLDVVGKASGTQVIDPEAILARYDLAFAKAKAAMEAMACGLAVILCDTHGIGGMVRLHDFDRLRRLNFGRRSLSIPHSVEALRNEIASYNAEDARKVSDRIRQTASADAMNDALFAIYQEVVAEYARRPQENDWKIESRAAAAFLQRNAVMERQGRRLYIDLLQKANRLGRIPVVGPMARRLFRRLKRKA